MSDVHWAAAGLLHRAADGGEIPMQVLREFAELVLHSELVAGARAVLDGPPEFAVRRAVELASVGGSKRSIEASEVSSPPYPCRATTEDAFHDNWGSAKPSSPGPSSGSSQSNGERFRRLRTPAPGVISSRVAPRTATPVRSDSNSDESVSAVVPTKKGSCEIQ